MHRLRARRLVRWRDGAILSMSLSRAHGLVTHPMVEIVGARRARESERVNARPLRV